MTPPITPLFPQPKKRAKAFRAVVKHLTSDPVLKGIVKGWRSWEGNTDDAAPPAAEELPWARITPVPLPATPETVGLSTSPWTLQIELSVPGLRIDDACDLWDAFELSLFPQDSTMQALLNSVGVYSMTLGQPLFGPGELADGTQTINAQGTLTLNMLANTRL